MHEFVLAATWALWFGILTSISPCPLATNVAAVSYIGRRVDRPGRVFLAGLLYALGRTLVYVALAVLLVTVLRSEQQQVLLSSWLQKYVGMLLGPILIVIAMFILELIKWEGVGFGASDKMRRRVDACGIWGALPLGAIFALSFCPVSAGLFFVSLLPMVHLGSSVVLPTIFGVGTALPVLVFAVLIAFSVRTVGKTFNRLAQFERWARRITGVTLIAIGVHLSLKLIFDVIPFWDPAVQYLIDRIYGGPEPP